MTLESAFDELRFGRERTLNLRDSLPTGDEAARRTDAWLRERQMARAGEVLVVTGRGKGSAGGVAVVRGAVARLLHELQQRGVVAAWSEHTAGAFVVRLASVRQLYDVQRPSAPRPAALNDPPVLTALDAGTRGGLRALALRSLGALGVYAPAEVLVHDEMVARFAALAAALPPGGGREAALREAVEHALLEPDDDV